MTAEVALYGGSFNPPHVGHLLSAACVRTVADVDAVWLMPAARHVFGKNLVPFNDRVALCEALAGELTGVSVTGVEAEVPGDGRTIATIEHLRRLHPETRFSMVIGTDILNETDKWFEFDRLATLVRFIVIGRSNVGPTPPRSLPSVLDLSELQMPDISSTEVRARLARGESVNHLVPRSVLAEIAARGLYR